MTVGTYQVWPKKLVIGSGSIEQLPEEVRLFGAKRVILFTDEGLVNLPLIEHAQQLLKQAGYEVLLFGKIGPNPTDTMVEEAVTEMKKFSPDAIVCIGGGSPLDAAKAANVIYTHGGHPADYDIAIGGIEHIAPKLLPFIAVPTTAGTGSEVTWVGVITDTKKQIKYGIISPFLVPDVAILDAELTVSLPKNSTAYTGADALTHLIEAYVSNVGFPIADAMCLHGIKMVRDVLPKAVKNGRDLKAREDMLVASMMAGAAFTINNLGLCHQMAHQLSAYCGLPHGLANAVLLPHVMRYNLDANYKKFGDIADALGEDIRGLSDVEAAELAVMAVENLFSEIEIPKYLNGTGADYSRVPEMAASAIVDAVGCNTNPKQTSLEDCIAVFEEAFSEG
ncbi:MAG: iron-containing alcohol dehydrogenase [Anaerofustis sp.]